MNHPMITHPEFLDQINSTTPASLQLPKPFKTYSELIDLLKSKGMIIKNDEKATRKLSQIGYYRLSGFWHVFRVPILDSDGVPLIDPIIGQPKREDFFYPATDFDDVISLYLFDKKLRLLLLDAIERVEIHLRSVIAHELSKYDPVAYKREKFIHPESLKDYDRDGITKNAWRDWSAKHEEIINRSKDTFIVWNKNNYKEIPFWVVVETWDFGLMSNYFNILNDKSKDVICKRVNVPIKKTLNNWLQEINGLRNRCAHHSRIWNIRLNNPLTLKGFKTHEYFTKLSIEKDFPRRRMYGTICILWYLVKNIGPSSKWIEKVANHIDTFPNNQHVLFNAMGFPDENGFPRTKFGLSK
ncbi:MAG: Abi family protein [Legionella sp.]|uniref:Abi family protein n=1 Tax=Legionella sp. TaxID=459 RepID=UPI00283D64A0|nr:Abi family protein [Legionella sp.]